MQPATAPATPDPKPLPRRTSVHVEGYRVERYQIIGTRTYVHAAWAPVEQWIAGPYATITHEEGRWWGRLGTERNMPPEIEALPALSLERSNAVHAWQDERYADAYEVIVRAFPEAAEGHRSMGDISLTFP